RLGRGILGLVLGLVIGLLFAGSLNAQTTRALIVAGVSGEPRLAAQFERDGVAIRGAVVKRFAGEAVLLTEKSAPKSDKAAILAALEKLRGSAAGDQILLVLIGHGSAQGGDARFNIPGPDITAAELARALDALKGKNVA